MTIKDWIIHAEIINATERLNKLIEFEAPEIMIDGVREQITELEVGTLSIGGKRELLNTEYISHEKKTGNGGKIYIQFNGSINYFPQARYGRYITTKGE